MPFIEVPITANTDDCFMYYGSGAWTFQTNNSLFQVGYNSSGGYKIGGGLRFLSLNIPRGSIITSAYLICKSSTSNINNTVNSRITGEKTLTPATFSTLANYQARRGTVVGGANNNNITTAQVAWDSIGGWSGGALYNSPDISSIIQEIVNLGAVTNLALFWDDHDNRSTQSDGVVRGSWSYDYQPTDAIMLHVSYGATFSLSFSDSVSLSDAISKNIGLAKSDSVTAADVFSRVATFRRLFSDSVAVTDIITKLYEKNTSDTVTLADTLSKVMAYQRGFTDGIALADGMAIAMLGKHFLSFAEALSLVDSISKEIELSKADVAALTDTFSSATTFNRSLADGLTLTDSATLAKIQLLTLTILAKSMVVGVQQQIKVMGLYSDGSVQDATAYCQFVSSNTDVATIDSSGLVMGISVGLAIITAIIGIVTTTYTLAILPAVSAVIPQTGIVAFADGNTYRAGTYLSRRFEYKHNSIGAIKVLASKYPVMVDLIFPDIPYTISVTVKSKNPQRVKAFLSEAVEVRINAAEEVSAVFLASNMSEFPT